MSNIKQVILDYLIQEDSSNVLGKGDQVAKFSQKLSQLLNQTDASGRRLNVVVDVMEFHYDTAPKLIGTFPVQDISLRSFAVDVKGVGVVVFNHMGKPTDTDLDLFCTNPRVI